MLEGSRYADPSAGGWSRTPPEYPRARSSSITGHAGNPRALLTTPPSHHASVTKLSRNTGDLRSPAVGRAPPRLFGEPASLSPTAVARTARSSPRVPAVSEILLEGGRMCY